MLNELGIRVLKDELIMDEGLPRDDAEEVDETLGSITDISSDSFTASGGIKDGKIDIGVGVSRVEEATKADSIRGTPEFKDTINVDEMFKEAAMLMPALPCTY